jgi:chromosome partitioning protein
MALKVIAIANQKGGVAKTTTSVNVGACLAMAGHKTLLIDLDPQGNATQSLNVKSFDHGTAELFESNIPLMSAVNKTSLENLSIIPSDLSLAQVEWNLLRNFRATHTTILRDKIKMIKDNNFDYCVIDCPPSLGLFSLNALMASQRVLIPVALDAFGLYGVRYLSSVIADIQKNSNKDLQIVGIVRTIWDTRQNIAREMSESLERDYPTKLLKAFIKSAVRIKESVIYKLPIVASERSSAPALQYRALTKEVLEKW